MWKDRVKGAWSVFESGEVAAVLYDGSFFSARHASTTRSLSTPCPSAPFPNPCSDQANVEASTRAVFRGQTSPRFRSFCATDYCHIIGYIMARRRWALVTGVSPGGMGEGEVQAFLEQGISVVATAQRIGLLQDLAFISGRDGASAVPLELDVTNTKSIETAVESVTRITDGRLDFLMNNAGYGYYMPLLDVDIEKARRQLDVNVWGVLAVTQAFFPLLRAAKGCVVNQGSVNGIQGYNRPYTGIYTASKAAVHSLSDLMRVEFAPFDVRVVTLVSGAVKTEFYNHKEGGHAVTIPADSVYQPIRGQVELLLRGSLSGSKGHDRTQVTRSTVAALLRWPLFHTRFIRRGFAAIKIWLIHVLLPTWLIDRWARQTGGLDKLRAILNSA